MIGSDEKKARRDAAARAAGEDRRADARAGGAARRGPNAMPDGRNGECVVLLHGLGRTRRSLRPVAAVLRRRGYRVFNVGYPSRRWPLERLAVHLRDELRTLETESYRRTHFVTHSMGGIVLRCFLEGEELAKIGRVVMLGPPNRGSELAELLRGLPLLGRWLGPAGRQLGTGEDSVPLRLGPPRVELGVIAGNRAGLPFLRRVLGDEHDGKVSVARARLEGMADFAVVPYGHTFLMRRREVLAKIVRFVENGRFAEQPSETRLEGGSR